MRERTAEVRLARFFRERHILRRLRRFAAGIILALAVTGMLGARIVQATSIDDGVFLSDGIDDDAAATLYALHAEYSKRSLSMLEGNRGLGFRVARGLAVSATDATPPARFDPRKGHGRYPLPRRASVSSDSSGAH